MFACVDAQPPAPALFPCLHLSLAELSAVSGLEILWSSFLQIICKNKTHPGIHSCGALLLALLLPELCPFKVAAFVTVFLSHFLFLLK